MKDLETISEESFTPEQKKEIKKAFDASMKTKAGSDERKAAVAAYMELKRKYRAMNEETIQEKLSVSDGMGAWIDDFKKSDAPQFDGKSEKERRDMAIAAFMSAKKAMKEEVSNYVDTYNDVMRDPKTVEEISEFIMARRRHIRRTETTGGNNDEY